MLYSVLFLLNSSLSYVRPIWISGLECLGEEANITQCNQALPLGYTSSCTHAQDAGLVCKIDDGNELYNSNEPICMLTDS